MIRFTLVPCLVFSFLISMVAQAAPRDFIQMQLHDREARVEELQDEIVRLDSSIERKLDRLEQRYLSAKDSKESHITVQQTKERLVERLANLAAYYQEQRELFLKEARSSMPRADKEMLEKIAARYDEHIDKRIDQITRLNQSLASPNPDSKKGNDKQIARRTREQRNATIDALKNIVDRLETENAELRLRMKSADAQDAEMIGDIIKQNESLIEKRTEQMERMEDAPQISAKPVSKSEALELRKLLEEASQDIKEDSYRLSNLAIEYAKECGAVEQLKQQLASNPDDAHSR